MAFNFKSFFNAGGIGKNRKYSSPFLELLEERLECATRVWDGSAIPNGTDGPPPALAIQHLARFSILWLATGALQVGNLDCLKMAIVCFFPTL